MMGSRSKKMLELCKEKPKEKPKRNNACLHGDVVGNNVVMFSNNQGGGDDVATQFENFPEYACSNYLNDKLDQDVVLIQEVINDEGIHHNDLINITIETTNLNDIEYQCLDLQSTEVLPELQSFELQDVFDDQQNLLTDGKNRVRKDDPKNKDLIDEESSSEFDDPDWLPKEDKVKTAEELSKELADDNGHVEEQQQQQQEEQANKKRKTRGKVPQPEEWEKNQCKKRRMLGKEFLGYRKIDGSVKHNIQRPERKLKQGCKNSSFCKKSEKRKCNLFNPEIREEIFRLFWEMDRSQKKMYVRSLVRYEPKKRCYVDGPSRRSGTFFYYQRLNNENVQVCKKMFLETLDIKEKITRKWVLNSLSHGLSNRPEVENNIRTLKRSRSNYFEECSNQIQLLKEFFDHLPKMDSHYCRKDSQKQYFEHPFQTRSEIYEIYKQKCVEKNIKNVSITTFKRVFEDLNLAINKPKKDQCDTRLQYNAKQLTQDEYETHIKRKKLAQENKARDKEEAVKENQYTFTMDVQAVKLCPMIAASKVYYKTRLQVHIFTIFNLATHQCTNYVWDETEADLQASVFTSCIIYHLEKYCLKKKMNIVIYSDGCGYQNRNTILSNALSFFSYKNDICIEQKYLEKGHTQMECDSTHALIERKLKGREITLPFQYTEIIREARKKPFPFDVEYLTHDFFKKYDDKGLMRFDSIRPGKIKSDPTVADLRCLKYSPDGVIQYRVNYEDEYKILPQRARLPLLEKDTIFKALFSKRLPIKKNKYQHLQDLKTVIKFVEVYNFYDNLPTENV